MLMNITIRLDMDPGERTFGRRPRTGGLHGGRNPRLTLGGDIGKDNRMHQDARDAFGLRFAQARFDPVRGISLIQMRRVRAEESEGVGQPLDPLGMIGPAIGEQAVSARRCRRIDGRDVNAPDADGSDEKDGRPVLRGVGAEQQTSERRRTMKRPCRS